MGLFSTVKRSKDERMMDELSIHFSKTGNTIESEMQLILDKKSTLPASLRAYAQTIYVNKITEGVQANRE